jgi:integrase
VPIGLTIEQLLRRYAAQRLPKLSSGERIQRTLTLLLRQDFQKIAGEMTAADVAAAVARVASAAPTHANRSLGYLRAFFGWAIDNDILAVNPARGVPMPADENVRNRVLTLQEIVDVWRSVQVLDYPFAPAIRIMILTGMHREKVASIRHRDIEFGEFGGLGIWRLPAHQSDFAREFVVALPDLARREIALAKSMSPSRSPYLFTTTGTSPSSGWSRIKHKLDTEIDRRCDEASRPAMAPWRLDDLRRSLVANVEEHLMVDHALAISCLHVQSGFSSLKKRFVAYSGCVDGYRGEVLAAWARLIDLASRPDFSIEKACSRVELEAGYTFLQSREFDEGLLSDEALDAMHARKI